MMESKKKAFSLYDIVMIGLMAAVVFVVTMFLSIRIPTPTGTTMIKLANAFVLLCGLLLGPVRGGLAAGIGSMIFDLMTPEYAPEAWITFLRFFLMGMAVRRDRLRRCRCRKEVCAQPRGVPCRCGVLVAAVHAQGYY